jgi:hypothetical protein
MEFADIRGFGQTQSVPYKVVDGIDFFGGSGGDEQFHLLTLERVLLKQINQYYDSIVILLILLASRSRQINRECASLQFQELIVHCRNFHG